MSYTFSIRQHWGFLRTVSNNQCVAESTYLVSTKGPRVFVRHEEAPGWAIRTIWNFYLFAVIHISEGKSTGEPGWYLNLAKLIYKKEYRGLQIHWAWADLYGLDDTKRKEKKTRWLSLKKYKGINR